VNSLYRPNFGKIVFNLGLINTTSNSTDSFDELLKVTVHELTHVVAFSSGLYKFFIDPTNNLNYGDANVAQIYTNDTNTKPILKTPLVVEAAKKHYNCATLTGMRLEDEGSTQSVGSHWERSVLQNEYMTASAVGREAVISNFTLSLFQDSGWYQVNFSKVDEIQWGHGEGCNFASVACAATPGPFPEYPPANQVHCNFLSTGIGNTTATDTFSNGCAYTQAYSNRKCYDGTQNTVQSQNVFGETFGPESRCVQSSVLNSAFTSDRDPTRCLQTKCYPPTTVGALPIVEITVKNVAGLRHSVNCTTNSQVVPTTF